MSGSVCKKPVSKPLSRRAAIAARPKQGDFTEKEVIQIETLASVGCSRLEIALVLQREPNDLLCFDAEIKSWSERAKANVKRTAYEMATSGKCPAMTIFYLKTRCGWRETGAGGSGNDVGFVQVGGLEIGNI